MKESLNIPIISNLRGVASFGVCLFHFIFTTVNYINNSSVLTIFSYGFYGIHLFFIISGIVIPLSLLKSNYTILKFPTFFFKRILRIEPTYIVAIILSILILFLKGNLFKVSFTQIVLHLGYLIPFYNEKYTWLCTVFWTLAIEFQYYLIISILILLIQKNTLISRLLFYSSLITMPFIFNSVYFFPFYAPIFLIGTCWCLFYLKKINLTEFIVILFITLLVAYFKTGKNETITAILSISIIQFFQNYSNKILNFFGTISYSLYLFHPIFGASVINILSHRYREAWQKPLVILLGVAVTIISSFILYRLVEKPAHALSKKIKY